MLKLHWVSRGLQLLSSGSDGLIKLWAVKTSECSLTLDAHEDKVWALDVLESHNGVELISGSADSVMVRWRDCTAADEQKGAAEAAMRMEQEQELSNAVFAGQVRAARRVVSSRTPAADSHGSTLCARAWRARARCTCYLDF